MNNEVTQTILKGAAKTFIQATLSILVLLLVPVLTSWAATVGNGGELEVDVNFFAKVGIAALGGGIAALISYAQNRIGVIPS